MSVASAVTQAQSFSLSVPPAAMTIYPGEQNVPITVSVGSSSYAGPVSITLTGLPSGITVAPLILTPGSSGTLLISAALNSDHEAFPPVHPNIIDPGIPTNTVAG